MLFPEPVYLDAPESLPGITFNWSLSKPAWDFTGYTATMVIDGLLGDTSVTVTVNQLGANVESDLSLTVAASTTAGWAAGVYRYRVILTAPDEVSNGVAAHGYLLVRTPRTI